MESQCEDQRWAVIVGSGFGAAVIACRLAQAYGRQQLETKRSICVLERGRRYGRDDFPRLKLPDYLTDDPDMRTSRRVPEISRLLWRIDQGLFDLRRLGKLQVVQAAGYGGGSLIYANVHLRPPAAVFNGWPEEYRKAHHGQDKADGKGPLHEEFRRVAQRLRVTPLPKKLRTRYPKSEAFRHAATALGRNDPDADDTPPRGHSFFYPPLAIRFAPEDLDDDGQECSGKARLPQIKDAARDERGFCNGCGNCVLGCQEQAKNTLDFNYLADAERLGVEMRTLCEVMHIEAIKPAPSGKEVPRYRVVFFDYLEGRRKTICARHVFLGAGAVGTTQLLLHSRKKLGPAQSSDGLAHVGERFFANGDNLGVVFHTPRPAEPSHGPTITSALLHVEDPIQEGKAVSGCGEQHPPGHAGQDGDQSPPRWFLIQDGGIGPSLQRALGYFRSPIWFERNRLTPAADRAPLSTLFTHPLTLTGQGVADAATALGSLVRYLAGGPVLQAHDPAAVPTQWIRFLPEPLRRSLERLRDASGTARAQAERLERRVLDKMGPETFFLSRLVDPVKVLDHLAEALAELHPPLGQLLREQRGFDLVVALLSFVMLGDRSLPAHALPLLAMGFDREAKLALDRGGRLRAEWQKRPDVELFGLQERLMRDLAVELGGELRTNPSWTLGKKPVTVHAQGGCPMGRVTDIDGEVYGHPGLYVVDAAAFPSSVGVNPSSTIAAVAERKVQLFLDKHNKCERERPRKALDQTQGAGVEPLQVDLSHRAPPIKSQPLPLTWTERMTGFAADAGAAEKDARGWLTRCFYKPKDWYTPLQLDLDQQSAVRSMEQGRDDERRVIADLKVEIADIDRFERSFGRERIEAEVTGSVYVGQQRYDVCWGRLRFVFETRADNGTSADKPPPNLVGLIYHLCLGDKPKRHLIGRKFFHDDPGLDIWTDVSTLYFVILDQQKPKYAGVLRVGLQDFLLRQLPSMDATRSAPGGAATPNRFAADEAARGWALLRFGWACFHGISDVYGRQV